MFKMPVAITRPHLPVFHDENDLPDSAATTTTTSSYTRVSKPHQHHLFGSATIQQPLAPSTLHAAHYPTAGRLQTLVSATSSLAKPTAARKMQRTALSDLSNKQPVATTVPAMGAGKADSKDDLAKKRAAVTTRAQSILIKQPAQPPSTTTTTTTSSGPRLVRPIATVPSTVHSALPTSLSFSSGSVSQAVRPMVSSASFSVPADWSAMGMKRKAADDDDDENVGYDNVNEEEEEEDDDEENEVLFIDDHNEVSIPQRTQSQSSITTINEEAPTTTKPYNSAADMLISPTAALATSLSNLATTSTTPSPAIIPPSTNSVRPSHAHLFVTDYSTPILAHMLASQSTLAPSASYMAAHADLNPRMREILVDWLTEVSHKFRLQEETMLLSVSIVDRFLSVSCVGRRRLQLVGCVGMLLACKYEEMLVPEVDDFVHVSDKAYSREEMIECEAAVLGALKFKLTTPSPLRFLDTLYAREVVDGKGTSGRVESELEGTMRERVRLQALYLLNIALQHYRFLTYRPALLALSAYLLSSASLRTPQHPAHHTLTTTTPALYHCTGAELLDCQQALYDAWLGMALGEGVVGGGGVVGGRYRAVERKFGREKYGGVNRLPLVRPTVWSG